MQYRLGDRYWYLRRRTDLGLRLLQLRLAQLNN